MKLITYSRTSIYFGLYLSLSLGLYLATSLCTFSLQASQSHFFAPSTSTMIIGNQSNFSSFDAANNIINPSILAFSQKLNLSIDQSYLIFNFKDINNIVVSNDLSSGSGTQIGSANNDYQSFGITSFHLSLPLAKKYKSTIGLSIAAPLGEFAYFNSGDPYLPEYVMYRSRLRRSQLVLNWAKKINSNFSFSLGAQVGISTETNVNSNFSLNSSSSNSSTFLEAKAKAKLGAILSMTYRLPTYQFYFSFHQQLKSELEANIVGLTPDPPVPINLNAHSLLHYDPHIFRLGSKLKLSSNLSFYTTLAWELWSNYQAPKIQISQNSGSNVKGFVDYENIQTQNILVPSVGLNWKLSSKFIYALGFSYRPSPLVQNHGGAGNSLDSNLLSLSTGFTYRFKLFDQVFNFDLGANYSKLKSQFIEKSPGQEDGSPGQKIGAPGYELGGNLILLRSGIRTSF